MIKTVGELKKFLANLSDDIPIVRYSHDMEKSGYFNGVWPNIQTMKKVTRHTYDAFDYIPYNYEVYEEAENGEKVLSF